MFGFKFSLKRKPKTSFTLQQFYDAVGKIAIETGATHQFVSVEMNHAKELKLTGYLNEPPRSFTGKTIEEVCDKLLNKVKEPSPVKKITIELTPEIAA